MFPLLNIRQIISIVDFHWFKSFDHYIISVFKVHFVYQNCQEKFAKNTFVWKPDHCRHWKYLFSLQFFFVFWYICLEWHSDIVSLLWDSLWLFLVVLAAKSVRYVITHVLCFPKGCFLPCATLPVFHITILCCEMRWTVNCISDLQRCPLSTEYLFWRTVVSLHLPFSGLFRGRGCL